MAALAESARALEEASGAIRSLTGVSEELRKAGDTLLARASA